MQRLILSVLGFLILAPPANARPWHDNFTDRLSVLAQIQTLNADLLSHDSATGVLQGWCDRHGPPGTRMAVILRPEVSKPADEAVRRDLKAGPNDQIIYRRVDLTCGDQVLSVADNWYLPGHLTPEMNRQLAETTTPFGVVVRPLDFRRRTLLAELLYQSLPTGWEDAAPARRWGRRDLSVPADLFWHRATLSTPDGAAFSLVVETYRSAILIPPLP